MNQDNQGFLISEKTSNERFRMSDVTSYYKRGSDEVFYIVFERFEQIPISWNYDSEDERNRVFNNVDREFGQTGNNITRRC